MSDREDSDPDPDTEDPDPDIEDPEPDDTPTPRERLIEGRESAAEWWADTGDARAEIRRELSNYGAVTRQYGGVLRTQILQTAGDIRWALGTRTAKWVYVTTLLLALTVGVGYLSWTLAGPLATIVYAFLFLIGLTIIPGTIFMFGNTIPGASALGSLNLILGAFAFGRHVLVQDDRGWQWCPAREDAIYIDGQWHELDGGLEHWSVLGWRPFGVALYKSDETLQRARIDTRAEYAAGRGIESDGGAVERGGQEVVDPPIESGDDGWWVVDLTKLFTSGIKKIGDIELIETAEEIKMREESGEGRSLSWWQPLVHGTVGLLLGCGIGYAILYL